MPTEPDITDPELAPVHTTEPTLPGVRETAPQLEPVLPSQTLDLEPVAPNTLDLEPEEVPTALKRSPVERAPEAQTKLFQFGAWILVALISSGVLVVLALLILLFR